MESYGVKEGAYHEALPDMRFIPFTAQTRMSGVDMGTGSYARVLRMPYQDTSKLQATMFLEARP